MHVLAIIAGVVLCLPVLYFSIMCLLFIAYQILAGALPTWLENVLMWAFFAAVTALGGYLFWWGAH